MSTKFGIRIFLILKIFFQVKHWVFMEAVSCYFFFFNKLLLKIWSPISELFLQLCRHLLAHWQQGCRPGHVDALQPKSSHHLHPLVPCPVLRDVGITFRPNTPHPQSMSTHAHSQDMHTATYQPRPHTHTSVCPETHRRCSVPLLAPLWAYTSTWKRRKSHIFQAINITTETSSCHRNYSRSQSGTTRTSTKAKITRGSRRAAFAALSPRNAR